MDSYCLDSFRRDAIMAHKQNVSFTPDAFDNPPEGPVGVHRGNRAWYAVLLPYVVVIVMAVILGVFAWAIMSGEINNIRLPWSANQSTTAKSSNVKSGKIDESKSKSDDANDDSDEDRDPVKTDKSNKTDKNSNSSKDSKDNNASDSNASEQPINKTVPVRVVNATKIQGHAAQEAAKLKQAGYSSVEAANPSGNVPADSVVWYKGDENRSAAEDIAKTLGISNVEPANQIATTIVVVLCK